MASPAVATSQASIGQVLAAQGDPAGTRAAYGESLVILRRLAEFKEKAQSLARRIKGAMVYPAVVISVAVMILAFIMIFIIPKFEKIFKDFGIPLPDLTKFLMAT